MKTTLIIVRHGNTFESGEVPRRVGARTDLPLTAKGVVQAERVAEWLKKQNIVPDVVISGPLKRHIEMASVVMKNLGLHEAIVDTSLTEIDYGPDENKVEEEVIARIGEEAITLWNEQAIVPEGWDVDVKAFQAIWDKIADAHKGKTVVIVTSNGTARFALDVFPEKPVQDLKLGTGCIGILEKNAAWHFVDWNIKP